MGALILTVHIYFERKSVALIDNNCTVTHTCLLLYVSFFPPFSAILVVTGAVLDCVELIKMTYSLYNTFKKKKKLNQFCNKNEEPMS